MSESLSISKVTTDTEFLALRKEWNELVERDEFATVFQTWEFQYHTWRISSATVSPYIFLVRDKRGNLIGCVPFGSRVWRIGPLSTKILEFASGRYCDYANFILQKNREEEILSALAQYFQANFRQWDVIRLQPIREDSLLKREDLFLSKIGYPFRIRQCSIGSFLKIRPDWENYEDALSKKCACSMRRKVRKIFRKFPGDYQVTSDVGSIGDAVNQLMVLHQKRMQKMYQVGAFCELRAQEEFQILAQEFAKRGMSKVHAISFSEQTIASGLTFEFDGTISYYQCGFDLDYRRLSPGTVLQAMCINQAIKDSATEFDFLRGNEPYKQKWTNGQRQLYTIEVMTGSWYAFQYLWWDQLRIRLSKSKRLRALNLWLKKRRDNTKAIGQHSEK